jgi:hypothetical protein
MDLPRVFSAVSSCFLESVLLIMSRLIEEPFLATTLQDVYLLLLLYIKYICIKHLEQLLRGTDLLITLIEYSQQDAEPQNKNLIMSFDFMVGL